ncbi:hypothetical protein [Mucilaginibacter sp. dw_454]|uniref:hypothetical protein n=1 Tax=Mucilaginibacter sp. dw_454 TaxID=2720079 RepID=UPI001BD277B6|nr:hypothetical protein [Mucilaginibacter sp. dw_454]
MRIVTLHTRISVDDLWSRINEKLNPYFFKQRQEPIVFETVKTGNAVEIWQKELYEGALFHIEVDGTHLNVTHNEHYVDDVNSLTIFSILGSLFEDLTDDIRGVEMVQEG